MKINKFLKKYQIIIALILAIILLLFIRILSPKNSEEKNIKTIPTIIPITPTITMMPISPFPTDDPNASFIPNEEIIEEIRKETEQSEIEQPLWKELPYESEGFIINHYIRPMVLVVYIDEGASEIEVRKEVEKWLMKNNFEEDSHEIEFRIKK
ncbi:hypothetical protein KKA02_04105 [Patescibacteria group bacterium]|nr:hypothetical protein [Patescibacteria group bacterium]